MPSNDHAVVGVGDGAAIDERPLIREFDCARRQHLRTARSGRRRRSLSSPSVTATASSAKALRSCRAARDGIVGGCKRRGRRRERLRLRSASVAPRRSGGRGDRRSGRRHRHGEERRQGHDTGQLGDAQGPIRLGEREVADDEAETAATSAGAVPPSSAVMTTTSMYAGRTPGSPSSSRNGTKAAVSIGGPTMATVQAARRRLRDSGTDRDVGRKRRRRVSVSVSSSCPTTWTSMSGDALTARLMIDPWSSSLKRVRRLVPRTSWVAFSRERTQRATRRGRRRRSRGSGRRDR